LFVIKNNKNKKKIKRKIGRKEENIETSYENFVIMEKGFCLRCQQQLIFKVKSIKKLFLFWFC
jgi:hypothetical protein